MEEEAIGDILKSGEELQNLGKSSTLPRTIRHRSSISRTDVMEALKQPFKNEAEDAHSYSQQKINEAPSHNTHSLPRSIRHRSNIEPSDVSQAIRKYGFQQNPIVHDLKGNTINDRTQEKSGVGVNQTTSKLSSIENRSKASLGHKSEFIPEIKVQASTPSKQRTEHELNDEGFEETQSLVSETPSQGTSSGCNYEGDSTDAQKRKTGKLIRADSSGSGETNVGTNKSKISRTSSMRLPERRSIIPRSSSLRKTDSQASLSRASVTKRAEDQSLSKQISKSNPRISDSRKYLNQVSSTRTPESRTETSIKKSPSSLYRKQLERTPSSKLIPNNKTSSINSPVKKRVERSNSRSSLRSSRSSLNSATSVSTVRSMRPVAGLGNYTNAIKSLTSDLRKSTSIKKPLAPVQLKSKTPVPASRSSSSGSSIGPVSHRPKVTSGLSTSFKENRATGVPASRSSSSGSSIGPARRSANSFMRPTASSAAKDSIDSPRVKPLFRQSIK